ncbi:MAG: sigma-70 family RNA polymerase sigma factor [Pirellulaceae bacterium]
MIHRHNKLLETGAAGLGQLFEDERDHLRNFLQRRINGKLASRIDASDMIQEVYLRAQAALPNYLSNPVVPPLTWLRHLSFQVLCEVHRKQFRGIRNPFREGNQMDQFLVLNLTSSSMSIASKVERDDFQVLIRNKLSELNAIDREVLEMRHVDSYSLSEIATMLGMHVETIKKRYYRALKRFKDLIELPEISSPP